jgi:hypothetical protein
MTASVAKTLALSPVSLDTFVRAYQPSRPRGDQEGSENGIDGGAGGSKDARLPNLLIVVQMEATPGASIGYALGPFRIYATNALLAYQNNPAITGLSVVEEGLIYSEGFPEYNPGAYDALRRYAATMPSVDRSREGRCLSEVMGDCPEVAMWLDDYSACLSPEENERFSALLSAKATAPACQPLTLMSRTDFVESVLFPLAVQGGAAVVGWDLRSSLARLAVDVSATEHEDGFSFSLWPDDGKPRTPRPRLCIRPHSPTLNFINFTSYPFKKKGEWKSLYNPGRFIDCATLAAALSGEAQTLTSACAGFGAVWNERGSTEAGSSAFGARLQEMRDHVGRVGALYEKLSAEYGRERLDLPIERAYTASSIGKARFDAFGITPPLEKWPEFPNERLGQADVAFYGARIEVGVA